jgi:hypothetical protein
MSRAPIQLALLALVGVSAVLVLSACGHSVASPAQSATSSATHSPTTSPATTPLTCTLSEHGSGVDIISATLSCSVSGAVASETSFALTYTAIGEHPTSSQCSGALQHGSGTCSQTYNFVAPYGSKPGTVAGETLPDHHQLGPVTPQMVS